LDVTLTPERNISGVFAGNPVEAHAAAVEFLETTSLETLPTPADAAITSAAGFPLDLTFYQSVKGLTAAQHVVKPGGRILVVAECAEGIGSPEFARRLAALQGYQKYLDEIDGAEVEVDQWQVEKLALTGLKCELFFYTPGVSKEQLGCLGARAFDNLNDAVAAVLDGLPAGARVVLIPEGPYTYARAL
jgi:nickel-dependent lactate racemase